MSRKDFKNYNSLSKDSAEPTIEKLFSSLDNEPEAVPETVKAPKAKKAPQVKYRVEAKKLKVRPEPSQSSQEIGIVSQGDILVANGLAIDGWLPVVSKFGEGFVMQAFIKEING